MINIHTLKTDVNSSIKKAQIASQSPNHDKFGRINSLPAKVIESVTDMLKRHSPRAVAEWLQDNGYNTDIKEITLQHVLEEYRRQYIPIEDCVNPFLVQKYTSRLRHSVNAITEMSELVTLQKERIRLARLGEAGETINPEVTKQMHLMGRLLKVYADIGIKAGLMDAFTRQFLRECQQDEETETFEVRNILLIILRNMGVNSPEELKALLYGKQGDYDVVGDR